MGTDGDAAEDDDALEGERYQSVRDLFRQARADGFDEDPPARIDALLMAAARQHAPEPNAGALERFRRWLVGTLMQPAVAGAVAVAVIGGAAGVLYMKGKGGVAEPTVSDTRRPEAAFNEPSRPPAGREDLAALPPASDPTPGSGSATSAVESAEIEARLREQMAQEANQRRASARVDRAERPGGGDTGGGGAARGGDGASDQLAREGELQLDYRPDGRDTATVITTETGGGTGVVGGVKATITPPEPPPDGTASSDDEIVAKEELEAPKNVGAAETTGSGRATGTRPSNRTQAENLLRQARSAAKKKDCPTVRVMAKRAKQLDSTYYASTFSRDAAVKDCL